MFNNGKGWLCQRLECEGFLSIQDGFDLVTNQEVKKLKKCSVHDKAKIILADLATGNVHSCNK